MAGATVAALVVEWTDEQAKAFAIMDNKSADLADWDLPNLSDLLRELQDAGADLADTGLNDAEINKLLDADIHPDSPEPGDDSPFEQCCPKCGYRWSDAKP